MFYSETSNSFYLLMLQLPQWAPRGWPLQSTPVQRGRRWALLVLSRQQRAPFGRKSATGCSQAPETFISYQWYPPDCCRTSSIIICSVIEFSFQVHKCCPALTLKDTLSDSWEFPFPLFSLPWMWKFNENRLMVWQMKKAEKWLFGIVNQAQRKLKFFRNAAFINKSTQT